MHWIYLSPHLDDAVLSCGGLIWEQVQLGERVEIWTIFAGDPPAEMLTPFAEELHTRWGCGLNAVEIRRLPKRKLLIENSGRIPRKMPSSSAYR